MENRQIIVRGLVVVTLACACTGEAKGINLKNKVDMASKGQIFQAVAPGSTLTINQEVDLGEAKIGNQTQNNAVKDAYKKVAPAPNAIASVAAEVSAENAKAPMPTTIADKATEAAAENANKSASAKQPALDLVADEPEIIFNFENADLQNLVSYIEGIFDVTFIPDDAINPMRQPGGQALGANKISFKTTKPLTKPAAWSLFTTFLNMAGLAFYQDGTDPKIYRITSITNVLKSPIPAFIGTDSELLPDNDTKVRYVYFVEFANLETIQGILEKLKNNAAGLVVLKELKAIMLSDSAYNIKVLMRIVKELDRITMPQSMSVIKLRRSEAKAVKELFDKVVRPGQTVHPGGLVGPRKTSGASYFPEDVQIIDEPRTNSLIVLGPREAIRRVEEFVEKIDVDPTIPYSPIQVHPLRYADAEAVARIMSEVASAKLGQSDGAQTQRFGGVRGGDQYLKPISFVADRTSNSVIVRGDYDDYLKAKEVMDKLDEPQPQVALEVLILTLSNSAVKELGVQLRSKTPGGMNGLLGNNIKFQTSGLRVGGLPQGIVTNETATSGIERILGDLVNLVVGKGVGNTILSLGADKYGIWGILQALHSLTSVQVVSNPYFIDTNKNEAKITLGETRRIVSATVVSGGVSKESKESVPAKLEVTITPQINSDGMIVLTILITITEFSSADPANGSTTTKTINTEVIVADKEIVALGGLVKNKITNFETKFPVLGDIPILGWLLKNKYREEGKENLLILISATIGDPLKRKETEAFTKRHVQEYHEDILSMKSSVNDRDLIDRTFFKEKPGSTAEIMDYHLFEGSPFAQLRDEKTNNNRRTRKSKKKKLVQAENHAPNNVTGNHT